jgi:MFS family permease
MEMSVRRGWRMNGCQSFSIYMLFFISGMAGLIYEVVWIRMMVSAFGATAQAVSVVVTSFMAGLALGGWAFGRWIDRLGRPLLAYVCLEVGIAVSAFALPGLLAVSERLDIFFYRLWPESLVVRSVVRFCSLFDPSSPPHDVHGRHAPGDEQIWSAPSPRDRFNGGISL